MSLRKLFETVNRSVYPFTVLSALRSVQLAIRDRNCTKGPFPPDLVVKAYFGPPRPLRDCGESVRVPGP